MQDLCMHGTKPAYKNWHLRSQVSCPFPLWPIYYCFPLTVSLEKISRIMYSLLSLDSTFSTEITFTYLIGIFFFFTFSYTFERPFNYEMSSSLKNKKRSLTMISNSIDLSWNTISNVITSSELFHLISLSTLWGKYYSYLYFTDEKTEAWR